MSTYKNLIAELSLRLKKQIYPNLNNIVVLLIENRVKIHIETDSLGEIVIIGAFITELPPGKFREHILKDALKANYNVKNCPGILSYMGKENILTLHSTFALEALTIETLIQCLKHLTKRARLWQDAIEEGKSSPYEDIPTGSRQSKKSIFGF